MEHLRFAFADGWRLDVYGFGVASHIVWPPNIHTSTFSVLTIVSQSACAVNLFVTRPTILLDEQSLVARFVWSPGVTAARELLCKFYRIYTQKASQCTYSTNKRRVVRQTEAIEHGIRKFFSLQWFDFIWWIIKWLLPCYSTQCTPDRSIQSHAISCLSNLISRFANCKRFEGYNFWNAIRMCVWGCYRQPILIRFIVEFN